MNTDKQPQLQQDKTGLIQVTIGYLVWGMLPFYWKALEHVTSFEVLLHRILWCAAWSAGYFLVLRKHPGRILLQAWRRNNIALLLSSSLIVAVNWLAYIYAVTSGNLLQASLGYYICPILIVLLGVLLFKESMTGLQKLALVFCALGVLYSTLRVDGFPWLSLIIAATFAGYGTVKKIIGVDGVTALLSDTVMLSPVVVAVMAVMHFRGDAAFILGGISTSVLLIGAGLATLLPLMLFIQGTIKIPYKTVGFLQFITPTMAFFLGVFAFNEPFSLHQGITFLLIILGVCCYILSLVKRPRRREPLP